MSYFPIARYPLSARLLNVALKVCRQSIEWNYGVTANLFKYFLKFDKLRLMESSTLTAVYTVATLFRNFSICLYGGQTSNYFNLFVREPQSFLRSYINSENIVAAEVVELVVLHSDKCWRAHHHTSTCSRYPS